MDTVYLLPILISVIAFLYASVGHGGASGYLALMALAGISPGEMKTSALLLNSLVSAIAFAHYYRAGHFNIRLLWPFVAASIPLSFIGALVPLDDRLFKILLAACLVAGILGLLGVFRKKDTGTIRDVRIPGALAGGAGIGLVSGMIGIGGGVFLGPLVLLLRWADMKQAAAASAAFVLLNSIAGLAGTWTNGLHVSNEIYSWIVAAVIGGMAGAYSGSLRFNASMLKYILSTVLLFACFKLIAP